MKFNYQFTDEELRTLIAGLAKLPLEQSITLHQRIIAEAQSQAMAAAQHKEQESE